MNPEIMLELLNWALEARAAARDSDVIGSVRHSKSHILLDTIINHYNKDQPLQLNLARAIQNGFIFLNGHCWLEVFGHKAVMEFAVPDGVTTNYKIPYDVVVFEMMLNGRHAILIVEGDEDCGAKSATSWVETPNLSVPFIPISLLGAGPREKEILNRADTIIQASFAAAMLALETGVAEEETHPAPAFINKRRVKKGKRPLPAFKFLRVPARRCNSHPSHEYKGIVRLHWRHGHWRQVAEDKRVWVKSHLVGNPDLGFVDKHYRV